jgi:hypothetical protein
MPFAVNTAMAEGVSASRLRSSDLEAPFWGVRTPPGFTSELVGRAAAYFSRSFEFAILSHVSAAQVWGMPLPSRWQSDGRLHVSVPPDERAPRGRGVAGHHVRLHPTDVVVRDGIPTTTQARTFCDLASILDAEDLLAVADYLIWWRRDNDRVAPVDIETAIARHPTSRGMARIRTVVSRSSDRADSAPESKIRFRILEAGLPEPSVNVELYDDRGRFLAMPDLSYPRFRMTLDYEGDHHRTDVAQWEKDIHRVPRLEDAGWHHTRISRADLRDSTDFLARLDRNLRSRGWNPREVAIDRLDSTSKGRS